VNQWNYVLSLFLWVVYILVPLILSVGLWVTSPLKWTWLQRLALSGRYLILCPVPRAPLTPIIGVLLCPVTTDPYSPHPVDAKYITTPIGEINLIYVSNKDPVSASVVDKPT
jgi:hypothetical protein